MGLLISSCIIRCDESFVLFISVPLETKHQGRKQQPRELIRFPGYWLCRGSFLKPWLEHPQRAQTLSAWHPAVRKCQKKGQCCFSTTEWTNKGKKFIFETACMGVLDRRWSHHGAGAPSSASPFPPPSMFFVLTSVSGSFHTPSHQIRLFCCSACVPESAKSLQKTLDL